MEILYFSDAAQVTSEIFKYNMGKGSHLRILRQPTSLLRINELQKRKKYNNMNDCFIYTLRNNISKSLPVSYAFTDVT